MRTLLLCALLAGCSTSPLQLSGSYVSPGPANVLAPLNALPACTSAQLNQSGFYPDAGGFEFCNGSAWDAVGEGPAGATGATGATGPTLVCTPGQVITADGGTAYCVQGSGHCYTDGGTGAQCSVSGFSSACLPSCTIAGLGACSPFATISSCTNMSGTVTISTSALTGPCSASVTIVCNQ